MLNADENRNDVVIYNLISQEEMEIFRNDYYFKYFDSPIRLLICDDFLQSRDK